MFGPYIAFFKNENVQITLKFLYKSWFIWLPVFSGMLLWEYWVRWRRALFFGKQTLVLLELKLPREIHKSPQAAEFFISNLYQVVGEKNWYEMYWKGQVRAHFSLEIVSIDGAVHFYVWTRAGQRATIEANLYSQYPGIEIFEVPDYTLPVTYNPEVNTMWASEFDLTKKEDVFPIKTYIDYGMDKDPKEEYKIDPLTPLVEFLGSLPKGTNAWLQIIVRSHRAEDWDKKEGKKVDKKWRDDAQVQIDKIIAKAKGEKGPDDKIIPGTGRMLTDVEKETISALDRSVSKPGFDVGMRVIYLAQKDVFNISNVGGIVGGITHFNSSMNGFKPARGSDERYSNFFIAWMKRSDKKRNKEKQHLLDAYKRRAYFYKPFKSPHFVLNSEELATIFHFPGQVSTTPTFARIDSRKAEAPSNLPI